MKFCGHSGGYLLHVLGEISPGLQLTGTHSVHISRALVELDKRSFFAFTVEVGSSSQLERSLRRQSTRLALFF